MRNLVKTAVLVLALVTSVSALSHGEMRRPLAKFIAFYIASQKPNAPEMSLWERIVYGLAVAKTADKPGLAEDSCGTRL